MREFNKAAEDARAFGAFLRERVFLDVGVGV